MNEKKQEHQENLTFHQRRSIQRKDIRESNYLKGRGSSSLTKSLQTVPVKLNLLKLNSLLVETNSQSFKNKLNCLISILESLQSPSNSNTHIDRLNISQEPEEFLHGAIFDYKDALDLYADFIGANLDVRIDDLSSRLRDDLLHPEHGLRCIIYVNEAGKKYIILESDDLDMFNVLWHFIIDTDSSEMLTLPVDHDFVEEAIHSMDSEHDKRVFKTLLSKFLTPNQMKNVGIDPKSTLKNSEKLTSVFKEISNASVAAEDMLNLRLRSKIERTQSQISNIKQKLTCDNLPDIRRRDLAAKQDILEENVLSNLNLLSKPNKIFQQRYKQCVRRLRDKLIKENRLKSRRLGAGPKPLMDSDDEVYVAASIEAKSSVHGRRKDAVLYFNHRIKSEDLLSIANYNLLRRGKKMIKSSRTVSLRSRPRRINTREGQRHKGINEKELQYK